ncbi:hypothetical protein VTL71DRAFT_14191 [Oculimacula yallundae]|uniref:Uncharacterized protein n=1 Tax=Oculimacula yallundae TaxID=86028 RepID=A0ABR4CJ43_9HELO
MQDYECGLSEPFDTIIVDATPSLPRTGNRTNSRISQIQKMPRARRTFFTPKKRKRIPNDETETEVSSSGETEQKDTAGSKKRKENAATHEDSKINAAKSQQLTVPKINGMRNTTASTSVSLPEEIISRAKLPPMGQFRLGSRSASGETLRSIHRKENSGITETSISTDELSLQRDLSLNTLTSHPPPNWFYGGVPRCNSQWVICIRPRQPTYYHPSWSAAERKEADTKTMEFMKWGEETIERDKEARVYSVREKEIGTADTCHWVCKVTSNSVFWWQCHWYRGRQSWVVNAALDGYDEYLGDGAFDRLVREKKIEAWSGYPIRKKKKHEPWSGFPIADEKLDVELHEYSLYTEQLHKEAYQGWEH